MFASAVNENTNQPYHHMTISRQQEESIRRLSEFSQWLEKNPTAIQDFEPVLDDKNEDDDDKPYVVRNHINRLLHDFRGAIVEHNEHELVDIMADMMKALAFLRQTVEVPQKSLAMFEVVREKWMRYYFEKYIKLPDTRDVIEQAEREDLLARLINLKSSEYLTRKELAHVQLGVSHFEVKRVRNLVEKYEGVEQLRRQDGEPVVVLHTFTRNEMVGKGTVLLCNLTENGVSYEQLVPNKTFIQTREQNGNKHYRLRNVEAYRNLVRGNIENNVVLVVTESTSADYAT
jgi:hypothetical protein